MKKIVRRTIWGFGILVGLLVIGIGVFVFNFYMATRGMTPGETSAINDSVYCVKDKFVNAFIFKGEQGYLMVDAGIGKSSFLNELKKIGLTPDQITTILLTHTDTDHTGAIGLFKSPEIYMHKDEEQMINGTTSKMPIFKNIWKYGPYHLFNSQDTLKLNGLTIKVFHTPGHTPGSVCYSINNDYLLTGDNCIVINGKAEPFNKKFNMNTEEQRQSIKSLPDLKSFKYILTAHNGIIKY